MIYDLYNGNPTCINYFSVFNLPTFMFLRFITTRSEFQFNIQIKSVKPSLTFHVMKIYEFLMCFLNMPLLIEYLILPTCEATLTF